MVQIVRTIDAHVGGQPVRLIVDGVPRLTGRTMTQKREAMRRLADDVRRAVVLEPRGHADMCAALLTEPVTPGADAGLIFMDAAGFAPLSGHAVIGAATIAVERRLIMAPGDVLTFDTEAGSVTATTRAQAAGQGHRVDSVALTSVPAFVTRAGHIVRLGSRNVRVDVAYAGVFYAIVDTEGIGVPLDGAHVPELRRFGADIHAALDAAQVAQHPTDPERSSIGGVIFTGVPRNPESHLRSATVFGRGAIDRSPCVTGSGALMAVLDAMGLLAGSDTFVHEGLTGTLHRGRAVRRTQVGELPAIVPEVEGTAWITGEHTFELDEADPFRHGFTL